MCVLLGQTFPGPRCPLLCPLAPYNLNQIFFSYYILHPDQLCGPIEQLQSDLIAMAMSLEQPTRQIAAVSGVTFLIELGKIPLFLYPPPSSQSHPSISFSTPLLPIFLIWLLSPPVHSRLKGHRRNTNAHAQNGYQQQGLSTLAGIHKSLKRLQMLSYRETSTGYQAFSAFLALCNCALFAHVAVTHFSMMNQWHCSHTVYSVCRVTANVSMTESSKQC